jgi:hypothetical protein
MTPTEAAALLTVAAAYDNRKPDEDAAKAWAMALDGFRFHDCRDVIVAHYRVSTDWIMPAHVIGAVKKLRSKRISEALMPDPPPDLTPLQTIAWQKDTVRRIADGEEITTEGYGELVQRDLPELRSLIRRPDSGDAA